MRMQAALAVVGVALAAVLAGAQQRDAHRIMFEAARKIESVDGNLVRANQIYRQLSQNAEPTIAARALLRLAAGLEKLGDEGARAVYAQIVSDYSGQGDVSTIASARLSQLDAPAETPVSRRMWTLGGSLDVLTGSTISPDERFLSFIDGGRGNLSVHEFATGRNRPVTIDGYAAGASGFADVSAISRDSRHIAYAWFNDQNRFELRVASLETAGVPRHRVLLDNPDVLYVAPRDWSPDGAWIAVKLQRGDNTAQMGVVAVSTGELTVLKSTEWSGSSHLFFSPDSKYLGFDAPIGDAAGAPRDVFVMSLDGRQSTVVSGASDDTVLGWASDGRYLLFASDRGGPVGLWGVPVSNGRAVGEARLLKTEINRSSLGVSNSGRLYTAVNSGDADVRVVTVDLETGTRIDGPHRPIQRFVGLNSFPSWSPDGRLLAYRTTRDRLPAVGLYSVETGDVRELQVQMQYFQAIRWAPDGRTLRIAGPDLKGRRGPYDIDLQSGRMTRAAAAAGAVGSPDGRTTFVRISLGDAGFAFVARDVQSGAETELMRSKNLFTQLSPDGRYIAVSYNNASSSVVELVSLTGGARRVVYRVTPSRVPPPGVVWVRDSRGVLVSDTNAVATELLFVPVAGGEPRRIDIGVAEFESGSGFSIHPDGRRIVYVAGERKQEIWALENFLPAPGSNP